VTLSQAVQSLATERCLWRNLIVENVMEDIAWVLLLDYELNILLVPDANTLTYFGN
jgi:hypothetical protein